MQDNFTGAQASITTDHAYIHDEKGFGINFNTGGLVHTTGSYKVLLTTPAKVTRKSIHLRPVMFSATASLMKLDIHEDTLATSGTEVKLLNHFRGENPGVSLSTFKVGVTAALAGKAITASTAGGDFGNQPNDDGVEIVSDDAGDIGQKVTLYGTIHGATTVVISEELTLNGTTPVVSAHDDWSAILGVEMDSSADGTVTISEASGSATITTLLTTVLSAGIVTIADSRGRDQKLRIDANGASTKIVGVVGTNPEGDVIGYAAALDGTTEKDLSAYQYRTITKVLFGDVAAGTEAWVLRQEVILETALAGSGGVQQAQSGGMGNGSDEEWILEPETDYVIHISNIGGASTSTAYCKLFLYEEDIPGAA